MLTMTLIAAAAAAGGISATLSLLIPIVSLILGEGGIGYFLDRRSNQAARLAQSAADATEVFRISLEEERSRHTRLIEELERTKGDLQKALSQGELNTKRINQLVHKIERLDKDIHMTVRDINEIIHAMFAQGDGASMLDRWREVMIATKLAVVQADNDIKIVFITPECAELLSYASPEKLIGQSVEGIICHDDWEDFKKRLITARRAATHQHTSAPFQIRVRTSDDTCIPVLMALGIHKDTITLLLRETDITPDS